MHCRRTLILPDGQLDASILVNNDRFVLENERSLPMQMHASHHHQCQTWYALQCVDMRAEGSTRYLQVPWELLQVITIGAACMDLYT